MKLFNRDHHIDFQLRIAQYQSFGSNHEYYDSNWLIIQTDVVFGEVAWSAKSPCLLTHEVHSLINWFESIDKGELIEKQLTFMEPELEFHLVSFNNEWLIRVILSYNLTLGYQSKKEFGDENVLDFPLSKNPCSGIIKLLKRDLAKYPIRGVR